jgi:hypothetical protein
MELPNGDVFVGSGGLSVQIAQTPQWLFSGLQEIFAAADGIQGSSGALTEQVFQGAGSKIRTFTVNFAQFTGSTQSWGDANADDDITTKMQTLDHALATTRITSDSPAKLEFGEYSDAGKYSAIAVVPGETTLLVDFGEQTSHFEPELQWLDAVDLSETLHTLP